MISRERWAKLEPLVDGALDLPDRELEDYLATSCGDDEELRSEAERLLQAGRGGAALLEQGAASLALPLLEAAERAAQPAEGERVGPYELLGRLGEGGMGVVYQAHDPRLNRKVALKLLPPWLAVSEGAGRRLLEEARAASALDHPHIETVYDVGTSDDGRPYIAMAYYDGETLQERIRRGPLPVHEAIEIGCQIAAGLSAAHAAEIVHRDIKPGNLMLTRDGHVKIVDFGVAKVLDQTQSTVGGVGATPGTVAYMSPEQTRGSVVGPATDLWSLGLVLYEMLGGQRPFAAENEQALIYRIRNDEPTPLREVRPEVPESLAVVVERCLAKQPDERYPDAEALRGDLLRLAEGARPALTRGRDGARRRTLAAAGVAVFLAILALAVGNRLGGQRGPSEAPAAAVTEPALAVLPFEVVGPEADLWREGMVSLISANLDGVDGLRIIDPQVILARWDAASSSNDTTGGSATLRPIIRTTGASHVLEGSLIGTESSVRLTARITDLASGNDLGLYQAEGPADSILRLVDRASLDVLRVILAEVPGRSRQPGLARVTTSSLPALKAYLAGEREYRHLRWDAAVGHYNEAVELDSTFALPLHRLALAHGWLNHATLHREYSERAVALRDHLSERERLLLMGQLHLTQGRSTAIDTFRRLVRTYPDYAEGWYGLGEAIAHLGGGPWARDEYVDAFRRTLDLDPMYAPAHLHLLFAAVASGDADAARELVSRQESIDPDGPNTVAFRLTEALAFGDSASRLRARSDVRTVPEKSLGLTQWFLLAAPDQAASFAAVTEALSERGQQKALIRVWRLAREGRFSEARRLKDRLRPQWTWLGASWHLQGHEDPEGRDVLGPVRGRAAEGGPSSMWSSFLVGALGAHAADWNAADSVVSVLRTRMPEGMAPADSATAQVARALGLLLQAYIELRQGADAVPPELDAAVPNLIMVGPAQIGTYTHDLVRFAAGRMLQQQGDLAGAREQYEQLQGFRNNVGPPEIEFYLAQVYEGLGEPDRAITLYDRFLSWTARADPEYASMRQEAAEALGRLRVAEPAPP